jgi:aryl-alcohol dehydrogenase-like predicted oxidoreductase
MRYRKLGTSELNISRIGFGAWASGGGGWAFGLGPQDDAESIAAIHRALELGINWIDTAPLYGLGHSEEVVERAIRGMAERPFVFTKCGMPWDESGRITHSLRRESIRQECEASLQRLATEVIDLYQIHWNKPSEEVDEAVETLAELQREGKIRHIGVSNFNVDELSRAREHAQIVSDQPPYSVIDRAVESDVLPYCANNNIGVLIYSPMKSGLLSGKMTRERIENFAPDDLRRTKPEFNEPQLSRNLALVERLRVVADRLRVSVAEVAVAWTLHNEAVDAAIVGMRTPENAESIVAAAELDLSERDVDEITPDTSFQASF